MPKDVQQLDENLALLANYAAPLPGQKRAVSAILPLIECTPLPAPQVACSQAQAEAVASTEQRAAASIDQPALSSQQSSTGSQVIARDLSLAHLGQSMQPGGSGLALVAFVPLHQYSFIDATISAVHTPIPAKPLSSSHLYLSGRDCGESNQI